MKDQVRNCIQCESEFIVTVSEQERLLSKGFDIPKRCQACRKNKMKSPKQSDNRGQRDKRKYDKSEDDYFS
ncbi:MAG: zinc-ribbon domain containing protein [Deltaproteobacteria bacterium]|nr:zinc-ribbon domain containing protein [Deltaproteobacteria bacterium]